MTGKRITYHTYKILRYVQNDRVVFFAVCVFTIGVRKILKNLFVILNVVKNLVKLTGIQQIGGKLCRHIRFFAIAQNDN
jgi:hypothetical protein